MKPNELYVIQSFNEPPRVSVVIPVYNGERYLAQAIESALEQTLCPAEVIVVDDGSTDGSAKIARSFGSNVRYHFQPQSGIAAARNKGADLARGNLLAFLDADDLWMPNKLSLQAYALAREADLEVVFGHVEQFISEDATEVVAARVYCPGDPMPGYCAGTMLMKRDAFLQVGRFQLHWQVGEFIEWYTRAVEKNLKYFMLPEIVMRRRLHGGNHSDNKPDRRTDFAKILKAHVDRRRQMTAGGAQAESNAGEQ